MDSCPGETMFLKSDALVDANTHSDNAAFSFVWIAFSAHRVARYLVESHFEITFDDQVFVLSFNSSVYQQSKHFSLSCLHCLSMMDLF